ncbi:MAG: pyridoxine 5'-phosphate synthase [Proteobacteria bacterium]|nr:pyridoxine 5'-phosphate synthase [Pseudomonadota bacterium]
MTKLSVNLNKIALIRNSRENGIPNLINFVQLAINSGADGITLHPRPDQRHATKNDVSEIKSLLLDYSNIELNVEGNPFHNLMDIAEEFCPTQCTFVPDDINTLTSNSGWDLEKHGKQLSPFIKRLQDKGVRVSLFMEPTPEAMDQAHELGVDRVELYTEPYAVAYAEQRAQEILPTYFKSSSRANELGLGINAGHDLNKDNLRLFLCAVPNVREVSIGHAIVVDSLYHGFSSVVKEYKKITSGENPS